MSVAVIGSGLAAAGAAAALVQRGVVPIVLDIGRAGDPHKAELAARLSQTSPQTWSDADRELLFANTTLRDKKPKKLAFGSDYFYGTPGPRSAIASTGAMPPFSEAQGGFSNGWGAAALPPDDADLQAWPVRTAQLLPYYRRILKDVPYSARQDGLSTHFPILRDDGAALRLTPGNEVLLRDLQRGMAMVPPEHVAFGQARVLTQASEGGCQYCGECLSGCVYGAIYTANHTIDSLRDSGKVEYQRGIHVDALQEEGGRVRVLATNADGQAITLSFDRVFLAAGAVGSTRIVLRSKGLYDREARLLSTGGFLVPLVRLRALGSGWPQTNTQPGVFLEFKAPALSPHWVHTQLSTANEFALQLLGIKRSRLGPWGRVKKWLLEHVVLAHCNFHSDHANAYLLTLKKQGDDDVMHTRVEDRAEVHNAHRKILRRLARLLAPCGCYALTMAAQHGKHGDSFHVGGSLPMAAYPQDELHTDLLGSPRGWRRVHVVDSSVFPSLPGTTIGLLAMANAMRIASEVELCSGSEASEP